MAYPVSRVRWRTSRSLDDANLAAGASCACDEINEAAPAIAAPAHAAAPTLALLAPWLAVGLIAALLYFG